MKDGTILAEKIRKTVEKSTYDKDNLNIKLSCSLGGYTIKHTNNISTEDFINLADRNLYIAKRNGRNTTIFSEET